MEKTEGTRMITNQDRLYTARWCFKAIMEKASAPEIIQLAKTGIAHLTALIEPKEEPAKSSNQGLKIPEVRSNDVELWYPKAVRNLKGKMKTRGKYARGYPLGCVVHYDAGAGNALSTISTGLKNGYAYFTIARDGTVYQNHPLNEWGYHAGRSFWKGLVDSVSDDLVGIEVVSAGICKASDKGIVTWFGKVLPQGELRFTPGKDNQKKGYYQKFTQEQETALVELILWMKLNNPDVFSIDRVVGHDEVSPSRKSDPGAALSVTMPEFRRRLEATLDQRGIVSQFLV